MSINLKNTDDEILIYSDAELMKRYEAETGECATWTWHEREFLTDDYIAWLESQLRWRPVSEKPEKANMYFVECKPYKGWGSTIMTTAWFDGEKFPWLDVVRWLPIPPAPEGEVK